jgi:solute carrier family 35 protein E3
MTDRSGDRSASISSSSTQAESYDDTLEKSLHHDVTYVKARRSDDFELGKEVETEDLLPVEHEKVQEAPSTVRSSILWMIVNTLATIGIVCPSIPFNSRLCSHTM